MSQVEVSVRSELGKIIEDLRRISEQAERTSDGMRNATEQVGGEQTRQIRQTGGFLSSLGGLSKRVARSIGDDFKTALNLGSLKAGLSLGNQFKENIAQTITLSDQVRKLGNVFGIANSRFSDFQAKLVKGLGQVGLSSDAATNSLKGLAETQVRGEDNLVEYSKVAGQLASVGQERGKEGAIAQGIASVIQARGQNPNDLGAMRNVAESLRKAYNATGKAPTEILATMQSLFAAMPEDLRKEIPTRGLMNLAVAGETAGPNSTAFLEEYLGKSPVARMGLDARGFKGVFGKEGLNTDQFRTAAAGLFKEFEGDKRLMAQTLGLSEEAAEGFVRLYEQLDRVAANQGKSQAAGGSLEGQYKGSRGMQEAFQSTIDRVKSQFAGPLAQATTTVTDLLNKAADSDLGSNAVAMGGGALAALLAGGGLNGIMGLVKEATFGQAKKSLVQQATGREVQDVWVVNASDINSGKGLTDGLADGIGAALGKMLPTILKGALATAGVAAAGVGGYMLGGHLLKQDEEGKNIFGQEKGMQYNQWTGKMEEETIPIVELGKNIGELAAKFSLWVEKMQEAPGGQQQGGAGGPSRVKVEVEMKSKDLKATVEQNRGVQQ